MDFIPRLNSKNSESHHTENLEGEELGDYIENGSQAATKKRGSKPRYADIVLLNSSGKHQLVEAMQHYRVRPNNQTQVVALLGQEHWARGNKWSTLQHQAKSAGWKLQGSEADMGEKGKPRAGTCIATRSHIGLGLASGITIDLSPAGSEGRLAAAWAEGIIDGGIMAISVYLWHTEGLSARNLSILNAAGEAVAKHGGPWLLGGDFNMEPQELAVASRWLSKIGGVIRAPETATCINGNRTLDYVVIGIRIAGAVHSITIDLTFEEASPHYAVVIRMKCSASKAMIKKLVKPKAFPPDRPIGCGREPIEPDQDIMANLAGATLEDSGPAQEAYERLMMLAEGELCGIHDAVNCKGIPEETYLGHGEAPRFAWKQVLPDSGGSVGRLCKHSRALLWFGRRVNEMAGLLNLISSAAQAKK